MSEKAARSFSGRVWRQFRRRKLSMAALVLLAGLFGVALLAEQLASDKPVAVRLAGQTHWFPNVRQPAALRNDTVHSLRARVDASLGEWMIEPLIPFGPNQTYSG
ncbi:MAG: hypothetical protein ACYC8T_39395, partial [Myxococcaceae bacterium]